MNATTAAMEPVERDIVYREYSDGDEKAIAELYNCVFKRNITVDDWHWAYGENPVQRRDIILAFSGSTLVGQSAGVPLTYRCRGTLVRATRTQNVMVHPDFQGKGIFTQALKQMTDYIYRQHLDLVVTFPNNNSLPAFIRKLDYRHVADVYTYQMSDNALTTPSPCGLTITIDECAKFNESDHNFMLTCLNQYVFHNFRDVHYLAWRYNSRSKKDYRTLRAYHGDKLVALVVFKYYSDASGVDLVEFFTDSSTNIIADLLDEIRKYYVSRNVPVHGYSIWLFPHYAFFAWFIETGFKQTRFSTHVVCKSFSPATESGAELCTSYYLSMGDSDVY